MGKVLVIEDERNISMVLQEALGMEGHEVLIAHDGLAGLKLLNEGFQPDLALLDLNMPGMNGRDFVMKVCEDVRNFSIILLTGSAPNPQEFPPAGSYQSVITKPFDLIKLIDTVNHFVDLEC